MASINVRLVAVDIVRGLKLRAVRNNRSLEGEVRHILVDAVKDDLSASRTAFLARIAELRCARPRGDARRPPSCWFAKTAITDIDRP